MIEVPDDAALDGPFGWALRSGADLNRVNTILTHGNDDLAFTAEQSVAMRNRNRRTLAQRKVVITAEDDPTMVIAHATVRLPLLDNLNTADLALVVHPDYRRRGLGSKLARWCEDVATRSGRTSWDGYFSAGPDDDCPDRLVAPGGGSIPASHPSWLFASARGWSLAQVGRMSVLDLPASHGSTAAVPQRSRESGHSRTSRDVWLGSESSGVALGGPPADDYEIEIWDGDLPRQWVPQLVAAKRTMSTDQPLGEVDHDEETWDEQRLIDQVETEREMGRRRLMALAIHRPTRQLAAYTEIDYTPGETAHAMQNDTLVLRAHRGRGLGIRVKLANLDALTRLNPATRRVYTWNAEENEHMSAINTRMGFRPDTSTAILHKTVAPA
jgi:GNAT superfamily N-acetyltransferase